MLPYSLINSEFILAENIEAYHDIWFLGDVFLKEAANSLKSLRNATSVVRQSPPYVYQHFNVKTYYNTRSSVPDGLAR